LSGTPKIVGADKIILEELAYTRKRIKVMSACADPSSPFGPFESFKGFIENKTGAAEIKGKFLSPAYTSKTCSKRRTFWKKGETSFRVSSFVVSLAHANVNAGCDLARTSETMGETMG
jgi:hypothetical protein